MNKKKKYVKTLWILLAVGAVGLALTTCWAIGTGKVAPRETTKEYVIDEPYDSVEMMTYTESFEIVEDAERSTIIARASAWRNEPIDMDDLLQVYVEDSVLYITETENPFDNDFLGLFPQPYELLISYPRSVLEKAGGNV